MLLQNPLPMENACPRRWSLLTAAGLFAVAVCASGIGLRAADSEPDKPAQKAQTPAQPKEQAQRIETKRIVVVTEENEEKPKVEVLGGGVDLKELRKALDRLPPGPETDKLKKDILKRLEDLKANPPLGKIEVRRNQLVTSASRGADPRLGVMIGQLTPALTEQLDLPKGQGILISHVLPGHSAAKAGLKDHDILMELNGKAVSSNVREFFKMLHDIKAGTPVNAVVIRKGKKEVVKGIVLPEAKNGTGGLPAIRAVPNAVPGAPGLPGLPPPAARPVPAGPAIPSVPVPPRAAAVPGAAAVPFGFAGNNTVMTSIFRTDDRFTGRHQEGSLIITVTGTVTDGKSKVKQIHIQDGRTGEDYESLSKVPERYRDKTRNLIDMAEKGTVKVETHSGASRRIEGDIK